MENKYDFFIAGRARNKDNILKICDLFDKYNISYYCFLKNEDNWGYGSENQTPEEKQKEFESLGLKSEIVLNLFNQDMDGERNSKNLLLVLPAGKAAHMESGIAYGLGKKCYAIGEYEATDTLYNIFEKIFSNEDELEEFLKKYKLSEKYKYTKMFLEIVIQNAYDEVYSRDNGKRVYIDPNADQSMEKTVNGQVELTDEQLEEIVSQKNGIFLTPPNKYEYYRPNTVIKDIDELEKKLGQYVEAIYSSEKNFYRIDDEHSISTYFYYLIKTLTNSDSQDLIEYIDVFIGFLKDNMFSWLEDESKIGRIALGEEEHQQYDVLAKRTEEYYGSETPYTMRYALDRKGFKYTMPFVRYGISGKEAYIYSIQRKGKLNYRYTRIKEIHESFNRVNSGIKHERDITPSMLISATMFMGMLSGAGVEKVRVSDFLTRRFGHYNGINSNFEEASRIQSNITNKFLRTFTRLVSQFKGIEITSYPNDIDSYLHLKLDNDISSNNPLLDEFFQLGFECSKKQKKEIKKNGEGIAK